MRARAYCAHLSIRGHWELRCMRKCPDQMVSLKLRPRHGQQSSDYNTVLPLLPVDMQFEIPFFGEFVQE
ncbi:hypothetical protein TNCV_2062091 [Trichonephila clavipes]|nr:hypothetical protein TNCV_2062091 [Trichonephila clavipes]